MLCLLTVARKPVVTGSNDCRLSTQHDVIRHHHHRHQSSPQSQPQQQVSVSRRQRVTEPQRADIECLSDVLLTRVFYSGLRSDDLCRCAAVSRRWNRLVWNPLLWSCIDLSQTPDCDTDAALRSVTVSVSTPGFSGGEVPRTRHPGAPWTTGAGNPVHFSTPNPELNKEDRGGSSIVRASACVKHFSCVMHVCFGVCDILSLCLSSELVQSPQLNISSTLFHRLTAQSLWFCANWSLLRNWRVPRLLLMGDC